MTQDYCIGIDIGGTNTVAGALSASGKCLHRLTFSTSAHNSFKTYLEELCLTVQKLIDSQSTGKNNAQCRGIGVGAPNGNYYRGVIENAPNLPFGAVAPLVQELKKKFPFEHIYLTNDANAAALGEMVYGGAQGLNDFIMITLGTGLGSGIVVNGQLLYGHDGFAGELGHVMAVEGGRYCNCGKKGCLETYCSAGGIVRTFCELMARKGGKSLLSEKTFDQLDAKIIEDAAKAGDAIAIETYKKTGIMLGRCLADFVAFSSPAAIFLFGGPVKAGALLFNPVRKAMEKNLFPAFKNKVKVLPSQLHSGNAAILGASALAWHAINGV